MRPHRRQPISLPHPWDSPGKNTGVGCHFLLQCMKVKSESEVAQSCPNSSDPMDCSLPGFSAHGIVQARVLEWGAITFSAGKFSVVITIFNKSVQLIDVNSSKNAKDWWKGCGAFQIQRPTMKSICWSHVPHLVQCRARKAMLRYATTAPTLWGQLAAHRFHTPALLIWEHAQSWLYVYVVISSTKSCPFWNASALHGC